MLSLRWSETLMTVFLYTLVFRQGVCVWSPHRKQGVYFLRDPWESSGDGQATMSYNLTFDPSIGDIRMDFSVTPARPSEMHWFTQQDFIVFVCCFFPETLAADAVMWILIPFYLTVLRVLWFYYRKCAWFLLCKSPLWTESRDVFQIYWRVYKYNNTGKKISMWLTWKPLHTLSLSLKYIHIYEQICFLIKEI